MAESEQPAEPSADESHRGGFGEFGGAESGLIDRAFREQIVLVGVQLAERTADEVDANLDELERLVDTAGADSVDRIVQRRDAPDPATFVGRGKADEILDASVEHDADTVVFDDELSPAQQFNLERILGRTALDRTAVILDIFAQNATTLEGKAQVELAQLRYRLPRLRGRGQQLSQQAGGIGTRGPGETQLEVDRRRIQRRLARLEKDLRGLRRTRLNQRKSRRRSRYHTVAIVGYTNAGKSTLLRRLTGANVLVEDRLFATLDATTRRLHLPGGETVLVTDTVGFIKKLPTSLVEAFMSTLEEVAEADLLVHIVDASAAEPEMHIDVVRSVLREIGAGDIDELIAFNKSDATDSGTVRRLLEHHEGSHAISANSGDGVEELLLAVGDRLRHLTEVTELRIPYSRGDALAAVHREGEVLTETHDDDGTVVHARLDEVSRSVFAEFVTLGSEREDAPLQ
ncbi:GTPase HflX [Candidatus Poriferisodalis sp.]|uniref:GTPase HflX n=1 Tax=Candidatus Poriferisodalis sp. TaxID=3101277 RepID=UPI003B5BDB01